MRRHNSIKALAQVLSRPIVIWRRGALTADLPRPAKVPVCLPNGYTNEEPNQLVPEEGIWGDCGFEDYVGHYNVLQAAPAACAAESVSVDKHDCDGKEYADDINNGPAMASDPLMASDPFMSRRARPAPPRRAPPRPDSPVICPDFGVDK